MFRFCQRFLEKPLVVAEVLGGRVTPATLAAINGMAKLGQVSVLVAGPQAKSAAEYVAKCYSTVQNVLVCNADHYQNAVPEEFAPLVAQTVKKGGYTHVAAPTSAFGKSVIPRVAAKFDATPIADVIEVVGNDKFVRTMYAGNIIATVQNGDAVKFLTLRGTSFEKAAIQDKSREIVEVEAAPAFGKTKWLKDVVIKSDKPSLDTATVIVAGGRGIKAKNNFKLLEDLAAPLNAAIGATRAVVDAEYCPNDIQVGQTGKVVAPTLYFAIGISGAIQHVAGIKDSKVIVAINNDPDAPIFGVSDYGLVEDLFTAVPKLTALIKEGK